MEDPGYVYQVLNTRNGWRYVGSTTNTRQRFAAHRDELERGTHQSVMLQRAWDAEHSDVFTFDVVGVLPDYDSAFQLEQSMIREYSERGLCYNSYVPSLSITEDDHAFSPEHRAALAASLRAHWDTVPHAQRGRSHCSNGHLMDLGNTHVTKKGRRVCRACHRESCRLSAAARRSRASHGN